MPVQSQRSSSLRPKDVFSDTVPTRTFPAGVGYPSLLGGFLLQLIVCSEVCILPVLHWICSLSQCLQALFVLPFCVCRVLLKMSLRVYFSVQSQESKHCWCQKYLVAETSVFRAIVIGILFLGQSQKSYCLKKEKLCFLCFLVPVLKPVVPIDL